MQTKTTNNQTQNKQRIKLNQISKQNHSQFKANQTVKHHAENTSKQQNTPKQTI